MHPPEWFAGHKAFEPFYTKGEFPPRQRPFEAGGPLAQLGQLHGKCGLGTVDDPQGIHGHGT